VDSSRALLPVTDGVCATVVAKGRDLLGNLLCMPYHSCRVADGRTELVGFCIGISISTAISCATLLYHSYNTSAFLLIGHMHVQKHKIKFVIRGYEYLLTTITGTTPWGCLRIFKLHIHVPSPSSLQNVGRGSPACSSSSSHEDVSMLHVTRISVAHAVDLPAV
jgi:hypothetical protein